MSGPNTSHIAVIPTLNNNFPCEGPKDVPIPFNFDPTTGQGATQQVNLQQLQQNNNISEVQSFFVDNSQNANQLTINVVGTNQRIILPPQSQAYLPVLMGQIQFTVSTTPATGLIVPIHCLNIPVVSCVWETVESSGGGGSSNVNIADVGGSPVALGQATAANSIPVVLSSDAASDLNLAEVGGTTISLGQKPSSGSIPVVLSSTAGQNSVNVNEIGGVGFFLGASVSSGCLPVVLSTSAGANSVNLGTVGGTAISLGQQLSAASLPVTLASDEGYWSNNLTSALLGNTTAVNWGATTTKYINAIFVSCNALTTTGGALHVMDNSGGLLLSFPIPAVTTQTIPGFINLCDLKIPLTGGATQPTIVLTVAPSAGGVQVVIGYT